MTRVLVYSNMLVFLVIGMIVTVIVTVKKTVIVIISI